MQGTCKIHQNVLYLSCDGVITDENGLIYMRARYYSPDMRRFINADVVAGSISNAITLNRFAYANGNPVSFVDPFGLSAEKICSLPSFEDVLSYVFNPVTELAINELQVATDFMSSAFSNIYKERLYAIVNAKQPKRIPDGSWLKRTDEAVAALDDAFGYAPKLAKGLNYTSNALTVVGGAIEVGSGVFENIQNDTPEYIIADMVIDMRFYAGGVAVGMAVGSILPVAGNFAGAVIGAVVGIGVGAVYTLITDGIKNKNGKTIKEQQKDNAHKVIDFFTWWK